MLAALVAHVRDHGLPDDASLRRFAREVGTSHRMLAYYSGSCDRLLAEVLSSLRSEERAVLDSVVRTWGPREAAAWMWAYYTDPARQVEHEVFFHLFGLALRRPHWYERFLSSLDDWVVVTTDIGVADGLDQPDATLQAQLLVSAIRGLLMDRMTTSDPGRVDAAFHLLLDRVLGPARTTGPSPAARHGAGVRTRGALALGGCRSHRDQPAHCLRVGPHRPIPGARQTPGRPASREPGATARVPSRRTTCRSDRRPQMTDLVDPPKRIRMDADVSAEAHAGWTAFADRHSVTFAAFIEALGTAFAEEAAGGSRVLRGSAADSLVGRARQIAADRRRRRGSGRGAS